MEKLWEEQKAETKMLRAALAAGKAEKEAPGQRAEALRRLYASSQTLPADSAPRRDFRRGRPAPQRVLWCASDN